LIIAVNTRLLLKGRLEGIGWFTYETLKRITKSHPEHHFIFIFDRPYDPEFIFSGNITPVVIGPQARHPFLYYLWFEFSIPRILKKYKADLFLSQDGYLSLRAKTPSLNVIHDLNFEHYPIDLPWLVRKYYTYFFPRFAKKANRIATVSRFSALDIIKQYNIPEDKLDVVYDGANEKFRPLDEQEKQLALERFTNGKPYFVFVGALHPRKNLANLFKAFDLFTRKSGKENFALLIVGVKKWWTPAIEEAYEGMTYKDNVFFAGRLNNFDLNLATGAAFATTYVSYFEGFGIPIVESFRCGTPVITSNVTSMPEIAGDAALKCDPFNPEDIANAMLTMANDPILRDSLILKGHARQELFTWDKTAELLWNSIKKILDSK
jgi:glycosyltransferase involved in cell wall biosynthesis